jgi:Protein of unknown function (DUF2937)
MGRIARTVAMAFGLCGGLLASQGPEFTQQYRQRLGGAIDELRRVVARFDADAGAVGRDREGALRRLGENADDLARRQGEAMRANAARLERLESQRQAFAEAGSLDRMLVLLRRGDPELMAAAFRDYRPGLQMTEDGLIAGAGGFVLAWGGALFLASLGRAAWERRRRVPPEKAPSPSPLPPGLSRT